MILKNFNLKFLPEQEILTTEQFYIKLNCDKFEEGSEELYLPTEKNNFFLKSTIRIDICKNYEAIFKEYDFLSKEILKEIIALKYYVSKKSLTDFLFTKKIEITEQNLNKILNKKFQL